MITRTSPCCLVLQPHGEIDVATAPALLTTLTEALTDREINTVVLDLRDVTFVDSSAVKIIVYTQQRLRHRAGRVIVENASPTALKLFRLLGIDQAVSIRGSSEPPLDRGLLPTVREHPVAAATVVG